MGFTEKMRDGLGSEGARIDVEVGGSPVPPGGRLTATVTITGGTKTAQVEALRVRLIEAERHWTGPNDEVVREPDAQALSDRDHLQPAWTRTTVCEERMALGATVEPGETRTVDVELDVPGHCGRAEPSRTHMLNVQADIKGQIDPAGNANVAVG